MNKLVLSVLMVFFPVLVFADNSLTFAPPASDISVVFLGNLFGTVDGVLQGTGSQIMGSMFAVFNAAVLALGGMIITYTLIVSTMNTAHEGQMLGQKWSSIWIPVRSTVGLTLLIPKASGYCLMQIFVMWVVVQGIGAADKIWGAALSYLNRGGVIIKAQRSDVFSGLETKASLGVPDGAITMLTGQVCMLGLQKQLESQRQEYLNLKQKNSGPCYQATGKMKEFCDTAVPDFVGSVNAVSVYNNKKDSTSDLRMDMPNFASGLYAGLNGICGTINWKVNINLGYEGNPLGMSESEMNMVKMTRSIAVQQMFLSLTNVAQIMVNNDPQLSTSGVKPASSDYADIAKQQFGIPYTKAGKQCDDPSLCVSWGPVASTGGAVLFNGTEVKGAINGYNGVMEPTLNLMRMAKSLGKANDARKFIQEANAQGWILAGSYFFDLVKLQGSASPAGANEFDTDSGLEKSTIKLALLTGFGDQQSASPCVGGQYSELCDWFRGDKNKLQKVLDLINGSKDTGTAAQPKASSNGRVLVGGKVSSTVYGFLNNSFMIKLPGQPGSAPLTFQNMIDFKPDTDTNLAKEVSFPCGEIRIVFFTMCLGQFIGNFFNAITRYVFNAFQTVIQGILSQLFMLILIVPLSAMSTIFRDGIDILTLPGVNPIVALANMGTMYINFVGNLWMTFLSTIIMVVLSAVPWLLVPFVGWFIALLIQVIVFFVISLAMPIIIAWLGIMVTVGMITAYYVPLVPYIIFTFGTIAWFISVMEAMVAAPIVALGVTHPEGHDAFGKGEAAVMILMNVFLRPSMMIIGFIGGISLSYVGVWVLNAGFNHAVGFMTQGGTAKPANNAWGYDTSVWTPAKGDIDPRTGNPSGFGASKLYKEEGLTERQVAVKNWDPLDRVSKAKELGGLTDGGYTGWASIFAYFFGILSYTILYMIIAQKSFQLIVMLPDRVLRWIGGQPENLGEQVAGWGEEAKQQHQQVGKEVQGAQAQVAGKLGAGATSGASAAGGAVQQATSGGGDVSAQAMQAAKLAATVAAL